MPGIATMKAAAQKAINDFYDSNRVLAAISAGVWTTADYTRLLLNLFHQIHMGTLSFATAAAACPAKWEKLREYMLAHAAEEMRHYEWLKADLASVGYAGPEPATTFPSEEAVTFIAFNHFNATHFPPARLASSAVLEGLALKVDTQEQLKHLAKIGLGPKNFSFVLGHTVADKSHQTEVWDVLEALDLTSAEWEWMAYSATLSGRFYKALYDRTIAQGRLE